MGPSPAEVLNDRARGLALEARRAAATLLEGEPEGVHDLRVALRRSRSLLRSFRPLLRSRWRGEADRMVGECRWAGGVLGPVRDAEVAHRRLVELLDEHGDDSALAPVAAIALDRARAGRREGRDRIADLGADVRFGRLLDDLEQLADALPFRPGDEAGVRRRLDRELRRLRRWARAAEALPAGSPQAGEALHETRKAAKRARYAAEALVPVLGEQAAEVAALAEQVQEALGTHRDTLLTRALIEELARVGGGPSLDRLDAEEQSRGDAALAAYRRALPTGG